MAHYTSDRESDRRNVKDVFLNGERIDEVFEADDFEGYVVVAWRGNDGKIMIDGDMIARKKITGDVRVELVPEEERV